ncbi:unnamed protein product, partial [Gulo gulo]
RKPKKEGSQSGTTDLGEKAGILCQEGWLHLGQQLRYWSQTSRAQCSADGQESGLVEVRRLCQPHSPGQVRLPEIIISLLETKVKTLTLSSLLTLIYTSFTFLDKAVIYLRTRVLARFCSWGPCYSSAV